MRISDLSPAQQRIVRLRARGYSLRQIAKSTGSSIHTIRTHCHLICLEVLGEDRADRPGNNFIKVLSRLYEFVERT